MSLTHLWVASMALAVLAAVSAPAQAADTPGSDSAVRVVPASQRLADARKFIAAKDWGRAISELKLAARDEPRNADVHNMLGYSYRKQATSDLAKAFEHYKTALQLDPRHKGAHEYIGEAYLMDKKPVEAQKHLAQLEVICGNTSCEEYADLAKSVAAYQALNRAQ